MLALTPITINAARQLFESRSAYRGEFNLAISASDEEDIHGVIAIVADGKEFVLGHIWTDGNAHIGSLLYGAAWRVAKALGYKTITI